MNSERKAALTVIAVVALLCVVTTPIVANHQTFGYRYYYHGKYYGHPHCYYHHGFRYCVYIRGHTKSPYTL